MPTNLAQEQIENKPLGIVLSHGLCRNSAVMQGVDRGDQLASPVHEGWRDDDVGVWQRSGRCQFGQHLAYAVQRSPRFQLVITPAAHSQSTPAQLSNSRDSQNANQFPDSAAMLSPLFTFPAASAQNGLRFVEPLLPTLVTEPPSGGGWLHEIKHDGNRTLLVVDDRGSAPSPATGTTGAAATPGRSPAPLHLG